MIHILSLFLLRLLIAVELRLLIKHFRIDAALGVKLGVRTAFCYLSIIENRHLVRKLDGGEAVGVNFGS